MSPLTPLIPALAVCAPLFAQDLEAEDPLEGHSHQGEAFNEGPRQAAYLMGDPDRIDFPVTTQSPEAQAFFTQGVGQLHGFWYFESERSFRQAAAIDPDCAMAYWGMAMANVDNEERAAAFSREAWLRRDGAGERERMHIEALAKYYDVDYPVEDEAKRAKKKEREKQKAEEEGEEKKPKRSTTRRRNYIKDLEEIIWDYPDDVETKALLVNFLWLSRSRDLPTTSRGAIEALLQQVLEVEPMHPAHHYRIHLWDSKDTAKRVVESAVNAGHSWPSVAHQWHMGGHIFDKLGRHADAAWQQEASARVDHAHLMRDRVLPDQIHNFSHNNEWLVRSLRHCGRMHAAIDLGQEHDRAPAPPRVEHARQARVQRLLRTPAAAGGARAVRAVGDARGAGGHDVPRAPRRWRATRPGGFSCWARPWPSWAAPTRRGSRSRSWNSSWPARKRPGPSPWTAPKRRPWPRTRRPRKCAKRCRPRCASTSRP